MATQISKIQLRRGAEADLPGADGPSLDVAEPAFATDTNRLFIGSDPATAASVGLYHGARTAGGAAFPFGNVEVLTEFSPANQRLFDHAAQDIRTAFLVSMPLALTGGWATLLLAPPAGANGTTPALPFVVSAQSPGGQFGSAHISYHLVDAQTGAPMRTGRLTVFHAGDAFPPSLTDEAVANPYSGSASGAGPTDPNQRYGAVAFRAAALPAGIALQYQISMSGGFLPKPVLYFRVEQPAPVGRASDSATPPSG